MHDNLQNQNLRLNILRDCTKFENKEIAVSELQQSLETYGPLLENIEQQVFKYLHDYSNELELIQYARLISEHYDETCKVIAKIRDCLKKIE